MVRAASNGNAGRPSAYRFQLFLGSAQYVVIVQYPIEEEKGSVGSSSLHIKHHRLFKETPWCLASWSRRAFNSAGTLNV